MKKLIVIILGVLFLLAGSIGFFTMTSAGARALLRPALSYFVKFSEVTYGKLSGTLFSGLTLEELELTRIKGLPPESTLRIQTLFVRLNSFRPEGVIVEINNARLRVKQSDPVVLQGTISDGIFDLNLYGPSMGLNEFKEFIYNPGWLRQVTGNVKDFDIFVKGFYKKPQIRGEAFGEQIVRGKITLLNVPVKFYFNLDIEKKAETTTGYVFIQGGELQSRETRVELRESRIIFEGDMSNPRLNLSGHTKIEDVEINVRVTGTRLLPDIQLTSLPPLPREGLLIMLATGKRWQGVEGALSTGTLSPEVATDFIDYFFFGGRGQKMGNRFGIKEIDVKFTQDTQGIGVKKALTNKLDVGYGVEKTTGAVDQSETTSQTVGGEYKVTDTISLELEKKTATTDETNSLETGENKVESEDKVMLKFETKF